MSNEMMQMSGELEAKNLSAENQEKLAALEAHIGFGQEIFGDAEVVLGEALELAEIAPEVVRGIFARNEWSEAANSNGPKNPLEQFEVAIKISDEANMTKLNRLRELLGVTE